MTTDLDRPAAERPDAVRRTVRPKPSAGAKRGPADTPSPTGGGARPGGGRRRLGGPRLPWLVALVGIIGTVGFAAAWLHERDGADPAAGGGVDADATVAMASAAEDFSLALTNFDGATIDADVDRIAGLATGEFRTQLDGFFGTEVRLQLKEAQASSRGEVRSAFVQSSEADRGSMFVVVDQTIANNQSPQPRADTLRMELGLVATDDGWRVDRVDVLTAPTGQRPLPEPTTGADGGGAPPGG